MKNIKKIIAIILLIQMILISPLSTYFGVKNNVYATTADVFESELLKQTLIPLLIAGGLVFKSKQVIDDTYQKLNDWMVANKYTIEFDDPSNPQGPKKNLEKVIKALLASGTVVYSAASGIFKDIIEIPGYLFDLIKGWVDENYDEGDNIIYPEGFWSKGYFITPQIFPPKDYQYYYLYDNEGNLVYYYRWTSEDRLRLYNKSDSSIKIWDGQTDTITAACWYDLDNKRLRIGEILGGEFQIQGISSSSFEYMTIFNINDYPTYHEFDSIEGIENIVDNPEYDWNNTHTETKIIVVPIKTDIYGEPEVDSDGYLKPEVDSDYWVDREPEFITNTEPAGIPQPEVVEIPEYEEGVDTKDTGILIKIAEMFQTLIKKVTRIGNDTATITENITGTDTGTGGIGDGIGDVPTDFEWGNFRHFFDIFFIFIYFIVILILIILKFLQIVFLGMPSIPANADLLTQYPTILAGVNYVKNLQVGGLTITVHQAFEFIFLLFFYIFIIKQIRKLYKAYVFEESLQNVDYRKDMKMDYYDRNNK